MRPRLLLSAVLLLAPASALTLDCGEVLRESQDARNKRCNPTGGNVTKEVAVCGQIAVNHLQWCRCQVGSSSKECGYAYMQKPMMDTGPGLSKEPGSSAGAAAVARKPAFDSSSPQFEDPQIRRRRELMDACLKAIANGEECSKDTPPAVVDRCVKQWKAKEQLGSKNDLKKNADGEEPAEPEDPSDKDQKGGGGIKSGKGKGIVAALRAKKTRSRGDRDEDDGPGGGASGGGGSGLGGGGGPAEKFAPWKEDVAEGLYKNGLRDPGYFTGLGQSALAARSDGPAERLASRAIELDGNSADALSVRSASRFRLGNIEGAREDALAAGRLDPSNKLGQTMLRYIDAGANGPKSKEVDGAALARLIQPAGAGGLGGGKKEAPSAGLNAGASQASIIGGERAGSASFANMTPSNKLAADAEGLVKIGDLKGALRQAGRAIDADKSNPEAYAVRAGIWNRLERYLLAKQDANAALALKPDHGKALNARAFAFNMTGHPQEAQADAMKVLAANPRDAMGYLNLAMSQESQGQVAEAKVNYQKASQLDPTMKVFYDEFLSKHPELNEGGASGAGMAILPAPLRTKKGAGAGLAVLGLGAAAYAWARRRRHEADEEEEEEAPAAEPPARTAEPLQGAETLGHAPPAQARAAPPSNGGAAVTIRPAPTGPNGGQLIAGNYEVRKELGRGGMGVVYEAFDNSLGRKVAIKEMREELSESPRDKDRFLSEARTVAKFQHPNIVAIYAILEDQGRAFLVFEHVEGGGLDKILDKHRKLGADSAVPLLKGVAAALDYSHSRKVIHRDLKPSNIMITSDGVVKVMDFGIAHEAKLTVSRLTNSEAIGTMAYMPPEQELGQASKESDVFAFAVMAYEILLGTMPFPGPNFLEQKKGKHFTRPSKADSSLPAALDTVFEKALDPEPKKRHSSAGEFAAAVTAALGLDAAQPS